MRKEDCRSHGYLHLKKKGNRLDNQEFYKVHFPILTLICSSSLALKILFINILITLALDEYCKRTLS